MSLNSEKLDVIDYVILASIKNNVKKMDVNIMLTYKKKLIGYTLLRKL